MYRTTFVKEVEGFVVHVQAAVQREDAAALAGLTQLAGTALRELDRAGVDLPNAVRDRLLGTIPQQIATQLIGQLSDWSRHDARFENWSESDMECVVVVRIIASDGVTHRIRLWLARSEAGWTIADYEDFAYGTSFSALNYATALQMSVGSLGRETIQAIQHLTQAVQFIQQGDMESASMSLDEIGDGVLTESLEGIRWMCKSSVAWGQFDPNGALAAIAQAEAFNPGIPFLLYLKASASVETGNYAAALASAERFIEVHGSDADIAWTLGMALHGLGRDADALDILFKASVETPEAVGLVTALAIVLPAGRKAESAERFLQLPDPWEALEVVADALLEEDDIGALKAIISAVEIPLAGHPWLPYYQSEVLIADQRFQDAATLLLPVLATDDEVLRETCEY